MSPVALANVAAAPPAQHLLPGLAVKLSADFFSKKGVAHTDKTVFNLAQKSKWGKKLGPKVRHLVADPKVRSFLNKQAKEAAKLDPNYIPVNFDEWYEVIFTNATEGKTIFARDDLDAPVHPEVKELAKDLNKLPEIESAYQQGLMASPSLTTPPRIQRLSKRAYPQWWDDPIYSAQDYMKPAPTGIDANYVWGKPGGDGQYGSITDIEWGWAINHEDLAASNMQLIGGSNAVDKTHGTGVMGEILMTDNTVGGVGIAPKAKGKLSGFEPAAPATSRSFQEMMADAIAFKQPGEVVLLEIQIAAEPCTGCGWDGYWRALEMDQANFDVIALATSLGITVIEPAGNGQNAFGSQGADFDLTTRNGLYKWKRGHADFVDSGAIMVGASESALPHNKISFSNYGSRIDCFGYGENVVTTMTNGGWEGSDAPGTILNRYTYGFSGTSSASPIVAGAAILLQSMNKAYTGAFLTPAVVRQLLSTYGTSTPNPSVDKIGRMPDMKKIALAKGW